MENRKRTKNRIYVTLYVGIFSFLQLAAMTVGFYITWHRHFNGMMSQAFEGKGNLLVIAAFFMLTYVSFRIWGGFKLGHSKLVKLIFSQFLAFVTIGIVEYVMIALMIGDYFKMSEIALCLGAMLSVEFLFCIITDLLGIRLYIAIFPPLNVLQINGDYENYLRNKISDRSDKYVVREEISVHEDMEFIQRKIVQYDAVLLNDIPNENRKQILKYCFEHNISVYYTPKIQDILVKGSDELMLFDSPLFVSKNIGLTFGQLFIKRTMDIVISLTALILLSPILLVTAVCIKAEDGGSVFFRQKRCTYDGKEFWILKFRSMREDAEKDGKPRPATGDDDRITKVGKVIRATRIDELPQLINILKGEMSIVGPRPERIEHVAAYTEDIPEFAYRLKVKGGLTGYAQVYGKYNTTAYDKLKMDLLYVTNYSVLLDMQIILETVKIIFSKESTEGFTEEKSKEMNAAGKAQREEKSAVDAVTSVPVEEIAK